MYYLSLEKIIFAQIDFLLILFMVLIHSRKGLRSGKAFFNEEAALRLREIADKIHIASSAFLSQELILTLSHLM